MARIRKIIGRSSAFRPIGFWPGFVVGLLYFSYILWWFWSGSAYVSILLGTSSNILAYLIILPTFVVTVVGVSLFWGLFTCAVRNFYKKTRPLFLPFLCAGTFVLLEYLRTWFVGVILYGDGGVLGPHWTFGNPAYLFSGVGILRQSASYWGIYGVDFLLIFIGASIFVLAKTWREGRRATYIPAVLSAAVIIVLFALFAHTPNRENKLSVSVIQTETPLSLYTPPEELLADFDQKSALLREASQRSDVVVFPESADFSKTLSNFLDPASVPKYFADMGPKNILIVDSNKVPEQEGLKSKVILIASKEGLVGSYDKRLLTPGGEYFPYVSRLALWAFGLFFKNDLASFGTAFARGTGNNLLYYQDNKIKVLVCSDVVSPTISGEGEGDFMVNLQNLAVFGGSSLMERELLSMARFRSAENGKYLALASNYGHSYLINQAGDIEKSTPSLGYQILTGEVVSNGSRTWYNKLGDWPILLISLLFFSVGPISAKWRKKQY